MTTESTSTRPCDDEWIGVKEFAAIVGKSPRTIHNEIQRGEDLPPFHKQKQLIRFAKSDVEAWWAQFRRTTVGYERKQLAQDAPSTPAPKPWQRHVPAESR